jgi:hypothetical protein
VRLSLGVSALEYREGQRQRATTVADRRALLGVAVSPLDWLTLGVTMPLVWREVWHPSLAHDAVIAPGDLDARARVVLFRDRSLAPTHLVQLVVGALVPTGPVMARPDGQLALEAQPGSGALAPLLGIAWSAFFGEASVHASLLASLPTEGTLGLRVGPSARASVTAVTQPLRELAVTMALDARVDAPSAQAGRAVGGWGAVLFVSPGVMISPVPDLTIYAAVRLPIVDVQAEARRDAPIVEAGVAIDL